MIAGNYLSKTQAAYDVVAADYHVLLRDELSKSTWDRAVLGGFAEVTGQPTEWVAPRGSL